MSLDALLSKLENVRKTGNDSFSARCPAHSDRTNSLSIRDNDGTVLVHCFAGCDVHSIVSAVGLELSDLFPPKQHRGKPQRSTFPALPALQALAFESLVVATVAKSVLAGMAPTEQDFDRLLLAVSRIQSAISAVKPTRGPRHG